VAAFEAVDGVEDVALLDEHECVLGPA
jgi:hypothetical protein